MKNQKFEIAVAGYDYRFKTYARDGVEASVKVKCFLGKPDAECRLLMISDILHQSKYSESERNEQVLRSESSSS